MPWKLFLFISLLSAPVFAATPEEQNGCPDSPDVKSAEEVCSVYKKIEGYYGRYNLLSPGTRDKAQIANGEPDACRAYYGAYMHGRNVLCSYRNDAKAFSSKATQTAVMLGNKPLTKDQAAAMMAAGENYRAAKAMHKKYLDLLTADEADLKKKFFIFASAANLTAPLGNENDGINNRKRLLFYLLNTEMNCKGGSISNIPALWWGGANLGHAKLLKEVHPHIMKSVSDAKNIANDAVNHWDGLNRATAKAASGLDSGATLVAPTVDFPEVKAELGAGREGYPIVPAAGGVALDKGSEMLVDLIKLAPGPATIIRLFVSLTYAGAVNHWQLSSTDVISSAVGIVSLPASVLVTGLAEAKKQDESMRALYTLWSQKALNANDKLRPQDLSQQFCQWFADEAAKKKQVSVQDAIKQANMLGHRLADPGTPGSPGSTD